MRFILIAVLAYVLYRLWKKAGRKPQASIKKSISAGEMVACSRCGTFILASEAKQKNGDFFCSESCLNGN